MSFDDCADCQVWPGWIVFLDYARFATGEQVLVVSAWFSAVSVNVCSLLTAEGTCWYDWLLSLDEFLHGRFI